MFTTCGPIFGFSPDHGVGLFWKWSEVAGGSQIKSEEINRRPFEIGLDFRRNRYGEKNTKMVMRAVRAANYKENKSLQAPMPTNKLDTERLIGDSAKNQQTEFCGCHL